MTSVNFKKICTFKKISFLKKIETITLHLLVQSSPGKFLCVIWNLVTKTYLKFVTLYVYLSTFLKLFQKPQIIEKFHMDLEKSINSFKIEER